MAQQQYYQVCSMDDIRRLYPNINLENCLVVNEDGAQFGHQQVLLSDQSTLVMESPQIIYQQPQQQHGEVQTQYIIQEEELQPDAFNGQPTQQIYYSAEMGNDGQIIQHQSQPTAILQAPIQAVSPPVQQQQQQQILIQHYQPQTVQQQQIHILQNNSQGAGTLPQNNPPQLVIQQPPPQQPPPPQQQPPQIHIAQVQQQKNTNNTFSLKAQNFSKCLPAQPQTQFTLRGDFTPLRGNQQQQLQQHQIIQQQQQMQQPQPQQHVTYVKNFQPAVRQRMPATVMQTARPPQLQAPQTLVRYQTVHAPRPRMVQPPRPRLNSVRAVAHQQQRMTTATVRQTVPRPRVGQFTPRGPTPNNIQMVAPMTSTPIQKAPPLHETVTPAAKLTTKPVDVSSTTTTTGTVTAPKISSPSAFVPIDLEDSITAAKISKQSQPPLLGPTSVQDVAQLIDTSLSDENKKVILQNGHTMTFAEYKRLQLVHQQKQQQQQQIQGIVQPQLNAAKTTVIRGSNSPRPRPRINASYNARPAARRGMDNAIIQGQIQQDITMRQQAQSQLQVQQQQIQQPQQNQTPTDHIIEREPRESARMLVILQNGEQRLITFTLPKESCTVQELLEQVGVPFTPDTNIQCVPNPGVNIDYLVTVGVSFTEPASELVSAAENSLQRNLQQQQQQQQALLAANANQIQANLTQNANQQIAALQQQKQQLQQQQQQQQQNNSTPIVAAIQKPTDPPAKYIANMCALCTACGYSSLNHAQCQRCKRIFTEEPKKVLISSPKAKAMTTAAAVASTATTTTASLTLTVNASSLTEKQKKDAIAAIQKKFQMSNEGIKNAVRARKPAGVRPTKKQAKQKVEEPVILMLSSDEEDNAKDESMTPGNAVQSKKTLFPFEPTLKDYVEPIIDVVREDILNGPLKTSIQTVNSINIGTFRFTPTDPIVFTTKGVRIVAHNVKNAAEKCVINLMKAEIVKVVCHFASKESSAIILYVLNKCSAYVRQTVEMSTDPYFSPFSQNSYEKRIVIQFDKTTEENKSVIRSIFTSDKLEEISLDDKNRLLEQAVQPNEDVKPNIHDMIHKILIYPPEGKGGISINTEDYMCLAIEQYLNDVIIDFYLQFVQREILSNEQREKTHIFSTFFYKRLTTLDTKRHTKDLKQTPAQKRHDRVTKWTKNVNLFDKDYIIIPINEHSHWFLAVICYPGLKGPITFDNGTPVKGEPLPKKKVTERKSLPVQIGNTTITPVSKMREPDSIVLEDDASERDEAEGDESDVATDDEEVDVVLPNRNLAIKQPCILIFDSLAGASRSRVIATLREYLTCEYRAKVMENSQHVFTKFNMPGHNVKVPQQTNFTDCGLYLLQYVEHFFSDPIKDYRIPIKHLTEWFEPLVVTKKREDISNLIRDLVEKYGVQIPPLPEIALPTLNGVLVETPDFTEEHADFEEEEAMDAEHENGDPATGQSNGPAPEPVVEKKRLFFKGDTSGNEIVAKKRRNT